MHVQPVLHKFTELTLTDLVQHVSIVFKEWVSHVLKCCQQGVCYRIICSCQFVYFLRQCILNYAS